MNDPMSGKENMATKRKKPNQTKTKQLESKNICGFCELQFEEVDRSSPIQNQFDILVFDVIIFCNLDLPVFMNTVKAKLYFHTKKPFQQTYYQQEMIGSAVKTDSINR